MLLMLTSGGWSSYSPSEAQQSVHNIFEAASKKVESKFGAKTIGTTISMPNNEVKDLGLFFLLNQSLEIEDARKVLVFAARTLLEEIQNCEQIQQYLVHQPWDMEHITISIEFCNSDGTSILYPNIGYATLINNIVRYKAFEKEKSLGTTQIHSETFEEAVDLL